MSTLTLPKTQQERHTLLSRQASLSLVLVGFPVTFLSSRVRLSLCLLIILLCMLCRNHPRILCRVPFLSAIAIICLRQCCFLVMLSACCSLLAIRLPFRLAYVAVLYTNIFACLWHFILFLSFYSRVLDLPRSLLPFENFRIQDHYCSQSLVKITIIENYEWSVTA